MPNVITSDGITLDLTEEEAQRAIADKKARAETTEEGLSASLVDTSGAAKARAAIYGGANALTLGGFGLAASRLGGQRNAMRRDIESNQGAYLAGNIATALTGAGGAGLAARLGARAGQKIGSGILAKGVAGGVEGSIIGAGEGVAQLAREDEITAEKVISTISSNALLGGGIGFAGGSALRAAEIGIGKAKGALGEWAERSTKASDLPEDIAQMDLPTLKATRKAEQETLKAARIEEKAAIADELAGYLDKYNESKAGIALKDLNEKELRASSAIAFGAEKRMDRLMRDPVALKARPESAATWLRQQENALQKVLDKQDDFINAEIRLGKKAGSPTRAPTPDEIAFRTEKIGQIQEHLTANRALQQRITATQADLVSPRLQAIDNAIDLGATPSKRGIVEQMMSGNVYSMAASAVGAIPGVGPFLAPLAAAKAASFVTEGVGKKLAGGLAANAKRMTVALDTFADVTAKASPYVPALASRTLSAARFAPGAKDVPGLKEAYRERSKELLAHMGVSADGKAQMNMSARLALAKNFDPIRISNPILADKLETVAVRRAEFLANKMPKKPDMGGVQIGPDNWSPPEMSIRQWARYIHAADDPAGIVERMASGSVTAEDGEVLRNVYPEMLAELTSEVIARLPELRKNLPYPRRLALSMVTGVPVDPSMDPRVFRVLQGNFANEPGTQGGIAAPQPKPQFGSVAKQEPTRAQQLSAG